MKQKRWTKDEEEMLVQLVDKCHIGEIAKALNRSESAVLLKAKRMGLNYITLKRNFSQEELEYIKNNWEIRSVASMARTLKVGKSQIQKQADLMQLPKLGNNPYRKWTDDNVAKLRKMAQKKTITELAKSFKTTEGAIKTVASKNCIDLIDGKIHWTDQDIELLKEYAKTMDVSEIAMKMNRSVGAVSLEVKRKKIIVQKNPDYEASIWTEDNNEQLKNLASQGKNVFEIAKIMHKKDRIILKKAREMGIEITRDNYRPWSLEEMQKLRELSNTKTISELVSELGRTSSSIKTQAKKLGLSIEPDVKKWTDEEYERLDYLVTVEKKTPQEIAKILGRTENSVIIKISRRGIKTPSLNKRAWQTDEKTALSDLWGSQPIEKIAKKLDRTVYAIENKALELGLGSQSESNYDGLKIKDICDLFNVRREAVSIYWVALGLKCKTRYISQAASYQYVEINDLYDFLEKNQNIWDSRVLEKNILGIEPQWLIEKRKFDRDKPANYFGLEYLTKQQLINARQFFVTHQQRLLLPEEFEKMGDELKLIKKDDEKNNGDQNG